MLDILTNKLLAWTPDSADKFHNNIPRHHHLGYQIWERTPSGYFLIDANMAEYRDYNGCRYVLERDDQTDSLVIKQQISALAQTKPMAQIENVTKIQVVNIDGITYTYSEHMNPVPRRGIPLENAIDVVEDESNTFIEATTVLFKETENFILTLDTITIDTTLSKYPRNLTLLLLNYDPETNSYFWSGNFDFKFQRNAVLTELVNLVNNSNSMFTMFYKKSIDVRSSLINYTNTECTIYQNL